MSLLIIALNIGPERGTVACAVWTLIYFKNHQSTLQFHALRFALRQI